MPRPQWFPSLLALQDTGTLHTRWRYSDLCAVGSDTSRSIYCTSLTFDLILRLWCIFRHDIHPYDCWNTPGNIISMDASFYPILPLEVFFSYNSQATSMHFPCNLGSLRKNFEHARKPPAMDFYCSFAQDRYDQAYDASQIRYDCLTRSSFESVLLI